MTAPQRRTRVIPLLCLFVLSCSATNMVSVWTAEGFEPASLESVMVIGIHELESVRRLYEDEFSAALAAEGIRGIPSYEWILDTNVLVYDTIAKVVAENGIDGVLVTRVLEVRLDSVSILRTTQSVTEISDLHRYYTEIHQTHEVVTEEVQIDTVLVIESKLFRSAGGDLVWAATSETLKPRTPRQTISSYIGALIRQLYGDQED